MPANNFRVKVVQTCMLAHEEACWKLGQHPLGRRNWLVLSPGAAMQCWILLMKKPLQLLTNSLTASSLFTTPQKKIEAFHPTSAGFFAWRGNDKLPWLFLSEFLEHLSEEFVNCTNFAIFCEQCPWSPSIQKLLLTSTGIQHCSTMLNPTNQAAKQSSNRCVDVGFRFFLCLSHSKISILSHSKSIYIYIWTNFWPDLAWCRLLRENYYQNFLRWTLDISADVRGPDHVFYFTARDSGNFGVSWLTSTGLQLFRHVVK